MTRTPQKVDSRSLSTHWDSIFVISKKTFKSWLQIATYLLGFNFWDWPIGIQLLRLIQKTCKSWLQIATYPLGFNFWDWPQNQQKLTPNHYLPIGTQLLRLTENLQKLTPNRYLPIGIQLSRLTQEPTKADSKSLPTYWDSTFEMDRKTCKSWLPIPTYLLGFNFWDWFKNLQKLTENHYLPIGTLLL